MQGMVVRWVLNAIALLITAALFQGIEIAGFLSAFVAYCLGNCKCSDQADSFITNLAS